MRAWKTGVLGTVAALALGGAAWAQDAEPETPSGEFAVSFNVGVSSDYVFRGVSQTDEGPQVFGGVDLAMDNGLYAGVWASNVDFEPFGDDDTSAEVDLYAGIKPEAAGWVFDLGAIYYAYVGQPDNFPELNYLEFKAGASRAIGPATIGGAVFYSPEFTGEVGEAVYFEANGAYTVNDRLTISGAVGRQTFSDIDSDYTTWNLGGTVALNETFGLDIRYWDTDEHDFGDIYESRVVASLKAVF